MCFNTAAYFTLVMMTLIYQRMIYFWAKIEGNGNVYQAWIMAYVNRVSTDSPDVDSRHRGHQQMAVFHQLNRAGGYSMTSGYFFYHTERAAMYCSRGTKLHPLIQPGCFRQTGPQQFCFTKESLFWRKLGGSKIRRRHTASHTTMK